jgi:hypothetical protein
VLEGAHNVRLSNLQLYRQRIAAACHLTEVNAATVRKRNQKPCNASSSVLRVVL